MINKPSDSECPELNHKNIQLKNDVVMHNADGDNIDTINGEDVPSSRLEKSTKGK